MYTTSQARAIGVFSRRSDAEMAIRELKNSNFPMDRVSVIVEDRDGNAEVGGVATTEDIGNKADEGAKTGAVTGGALGGLTGLLVGLGTLAIPGIGPIMLAGAAATALATTVAGSAIGAAAGSVLGALVGLGIPEERARTYADRVSRGDYLLVIDGSSEEIRAAEMILRNRGIEEWEVYDRPVADATPGTVGTTTLPTQPVSSTTVGTTVPGQPLGSTTMGVTPESTVMGSMVGATVGSTTMGYNKRAVGVFRNRTEADAAIEALHRAGFPLSQIAVATRDYFSTNNADLKVHNHFDALNLVFTPDRHQLFRDAFDRGEYLLTVHGTAEEVQNAEMILSRQGIQAFSAY